MFSRHFTVTPPWLISCWIGIIGLGVFAWRFQQDAAITSHWPKTIVWVSWSWLLLVVIALTFWLRLTQRTTLRVYYDLDLQNLVAGDVIGISDESFAGRQIRKRTGGGPLSHMALYIGSGTIIESVPPLIRTRYAHSFMASRALPKFVVLRPAGGTISFAQDAHSFSLLRDEALFNQSELYSFAKAMALIVPFLRYFSRTNALFCSELVMHCYRRAGIALIPDSRPSDVSPNTLLKSTFLRDVTPHCSRVLAKEEVHYALVVAALYRMQNMVSAPFHWARAVLWAASPSRIAQHKPMAQWSAVDFWSYYLPRRVGLILRPLTMRYQLRVAEKIVSETRRPSGDQGDAPQSDVLAERVKEMLEDFVSGLEMEVGCGREAVVTDASELRPSWQELIRSLETRRLAILEGGLKRLREIKGEWPT